MAKYKKLPVVIEAECFEIPCGVSIEKMTTFTAFDVLYDIHKDEKGYYLFIQTLEGSMRCNYGDYIIKGIKGEKYPCKPGIFQATYELVK